MRYAALQHIIRAKEATIASVQHSSGTEWEPAYMYVSEHLGKRLADYMAQYPRVKIVRSERREGLIRARLLGARHANADVLTYLDSHCECTEGESTPLTALGPVLLAFKCAGRKKQLFW